MPNQLSTGLDILRWVQIIESILFPLALAIILFFAWRDFRRLVNFRIRQGEDEEISEELEREVKEFGE